MSRSTPQHEQTTATPATDSVASAPHEAVRRTVVALVLRDSALAAQLIERLTADGDTVAVECPAVEPAQLVPWLERMAADVVLLDERWLQPSYAGAVPRVQTAPAQRVLVVAQRASKALAENIVRHRFHGFLLASEAADVCVKAVRTVVQRQETWMPRELLVELLLEHIRPGGDRPLEILATKLTRRETEVVGYVRRGFANKKIAESLAITEDTVKKHLRSAFIKLGVHRRSEIMTGRPRLTIG